MKNAKQQSAKDASYTYYKIAINQTVESYEVRERRALTMRPNYQRPELLATRPNQLWSWDITKLRGPGKWTYYC